MRFIRDIGTVAEVYADAIKLADEWQIKEREEIEQFRRTDARRITSGGSGMYAVHTDDPPFARQTEIRQSFDSGSGKPYLTVLVIGCGDMYYTNPATDPAQIGDRR